MKSKTVYLASIDRKAGGNSQILGVHDSSLEAQAAILEFQRAHNLDDWNSEGLVTEFYKEEKQ